MVLRRAVGVSAAAFAAAAASAWAVGVTPPLPFRHPPRVAAKAGGAITIVVRGKATGRGHLSVQAYYYRGRKRPNPPLPTYALAERDVANVRKATMVLHPRPTPRHVLTSGHGLNVYLTILLSEQGSKVLEIENRTIHVGAAH